MYELNIHVVPIGSEFHFVIRSIKSRQRVETVFLVEKCIILKLENLRTNLQVPIFWCRNLSQIPSSVTFYMYPNKFFVIDQV